MKNSHGVCLSTVVTKSSTRFNFNEKQKFRPDSMEKLAEELPFLETESVGVIEHFKDRSSMTDKDIRCFARSFSKGILNGEPDDMKCWMVCAPLCSCLNVLGVKCELTEGEVGGAHHYWIEFPDSRIIDATAKQFGRRNVFLELRPLEYEPF